VTPFLSQSDSYTFLFPLLIDLFRRQNEPPRLAKEIVSFSVSLPQLFLSLFVEEPLENLNGWFPSHPLVSPLSLPSLNVSPQSEEVGSPPLLSALDLSFFSP